MANTRYVSELLDRVRQVLQDQDAGGYRYPTSDLVGYLNDFVLEARRLRPDLFVGAYHADLPVISQDNATDYTTVAFPLPVMSCFVAAVHYVAGRAEVRDDEYAANGRASSFLQAATQMLMGGA
jgi:hypothetical protein